MLSYLLFVMSCAWTTKAALNMSGVFSSHMVLQQANPELGIPATHIFGMAFLNETVQITGSKGFPGPFKLTTNATTHNRYPGYGNFTQEIIGDSTDSTYPGPYSITIESYDMNNQVTGNLTITDVYFGDVFLCSGQSNMEFNVDQCSNSAYEKNLSNNFPNIRLLNPVHTMSNFTLQNLTTESDIGWRIANNETLGGFSCVCWIASRLLAEWLYTTTGKKPYLGLIESDIGGTSIHFWAPGVVGEVCNSTGMLPSTGECASKGPPYYAFPGSIFNAMINPVAMYKTGLSIRQAIWYQGEADSGENDLMTQQAYECELNGLITGWREQFNYTTMPIIVVQLPAGGQNPYAIQKTYPFQFTNWQGIQAAEYEVSKMNNYVGLVTAQDQGQGTLHYPFKQIVAQRVYYWMRYLTYNDKTINPEGPQYKVAYKKNANDLTVYINVTKYGTGLKLQEAVNCTKLGGVNVYVGPPNTTNITNFKCCDGGGVNTVRLRLDGWYWVRRDEQGHISYPPMLWNWMPANVSFVGANTIAVTPMLFPVGSPVPNCSPKCTFMYSEAISVRQIMIGVTDGCAIANSYGIPIASAQVYDVVVDPLIRYNNDNTYKRKNDL